MYLLKQYLLYNSDKRIVMSEKLQQDHFKVAPKKHEDPAASTDDGKVEKPEQYLAGRGAQFNTKNRFLKNERTREHIEGIDDWS